MRSRFGALLLAILVTFSSCAHAGSFFEQYLLDVAVIVQRSPRYSQTMYKYRGKNFSVRGCGPSSVVNALCVSASVEEQNTADTLLRETMRLLTYNFNPETTGMDIKYIARMENPDPAKFPALSKLKAQFGIWQILESTLDEETVNVFADQAKATDGPAILMGFYTLRSHWEELAQMLRSLTDMGLGNAIVTLSFLGCGTSGTGAPFRLSDGHYASMCFHCGAFSKDTSMYLVDSNPRALPGESLTLGRYYEYYALDAAGQSIADSYDIFRISQSILGMRLKEEHLNAIAGLRLENEETEAARAESELLEQLLFYGKGLMMIMIP